MVYSPCRARRIAAFIGRIRWDSFVVLVRAAVVEVLLAAPAAPPGCVESGVFNFECCYVDDVAVVIVFASPRGLPLSPRGCTRPLSVSWMRTVLGFGCACVRFVPFLVSRLDGTVGLASFCVC